jgi:citrate lyase beta subunit
VIHEAHRPQVEELERAQTIIAAYERAARAGSAVAVSAAGQFVDRAVLRQAQALVELDASLSAPEAGPETSQVRS